MDFIGTALECSFYFPTSRTFEKNYSTMGLVYADIELVNGEDLVLARRHIIGEDEIRRMPVNIRVDTGANMLAINESIQEQLQLPVVEKRKVELANGHIVEYDVVSPVEVLFKNRRCNCSAMVLPGNSEPLLGAIPLEDMDVLVHPQRQELMVNPEHPYFVQMKMK
jgi:clan AA aspartic protease